MTQVVSFSVGIALAVGAALAQAAPASKPSPAMTADQQRGLVQEYCIGCHNYADNAGGLELELFDPAKADEFADVAEKVLRKMRAGMMPPAGEKRPSLDEARAFATSVEGTIDAHAHPNLVQPRLHRLNRTEYANAVRDLLGLELDSTQFLPPDDASRGFDNQAGALTLSPALLEAYLSAAARVSRVAVGTAVTPTQVTYRIPEDTTQNYHVDGLPFGTRGGTAVTHTFPADGSYTFKVFSVNLGNMGNFRPFGEIRGEQLLAYVDGKRVAKIDWDKAYGVTRGLDDEGNGQLRTIDVTLPVSAGPHQVGVTFLATNLAPGLDMNRAFERSTIETGGLPGFTFYPHIGSVRIDGPADAKPAVDSPSRRSIFSCRPARDSDEAACAKQIAQRLAHRAFRGFDTPRHVDTLMSFYDSSRSNGGKFDDGVEAIVQRTLADPLFVYRVEGAPSDVVPGVGYRIGGLDLASRLSFFLWSSLPDDKLLELGASGALLKDDVLRQQVRRMLADPRATALTTNFAGQWLALRNLSGHTPVVAQFPDFDDNLRQAFRRETELLFDSILQDDRSVLDLLTADYTFVNERLAKHYGIPGIKGSEFRRVQLDGELASRRGLFGKGAVLTVSSQPGRTSPVIRGQWVLKTVLGVPAPDPPANVPALEAKNSDAAGNAKVPTLREQLEEHRKNPACAGCHKMMDPIGFAMEPFDAVGRARSIDGGQPIDSKGVLYDGVPVDGIGGIRDFVMRYQESYVRNVTQNLLTYAMGRGVEYNDMPRVRALMKTVQPNGYRLRDLVEAIALSDAFRMNTTPLAGPSSGDRLTAAAVSGGK